MVNDEYAGENRPLRSGNKCIRGIRDAKTSFETHNHRITCVVICSKSGRSIPPIGELRTSSGRPTMTAVGMRKRAGRVKHVKLRIRLQRTASCARINGGGEAEGEGRGSACKRSAPSCSESFIATKALSYTVNHTANNTTAVVLAQAAIQLTLRDALAKKKLRRLVRVVVAVVLHEIVRLSRETRLNPAVKVLEKLLSNGGEEEVVV